jgi:hypothetical protein
MLFDFGHDVKRLPEDDQGARPVTIDGLPRDAKPVSERAETFTVADAPDQDRAFERGEMPGDFIKKDV